MREKVREPETETGSKAWRKREKGMPDEKGIVVSGS